MTSKEMIDVFKLIDLCKEESEGVFDITFKVDKFGLHLIGKRLGSINYLTGEETKTLNYKAMYLDYELKSNSSLEYVCKRAIDIFKQKAKDGVLDEFAKRLDVEENEEEDDGR